MSSYLAFASLLSGIVGLIIFYAKKKYDRANNPIYQHEQRLKNIDSAIAKGDANAVNDQLDSMLGRVQDLQSIRSGQDGDKNGKG